MTGYDSSHCFVLYSRTTGQQDIRTAEQWQQKAKGIIMCKAKTICFQGKLISYWIPVLISSGLLRK
jgi:hypothetical protein